MTGPSLTERAEALYPDLRRLARQRLRQHQPFTLLDTTALVHEAWLRLPAGLGAAERQQLLAYAARTMRSVIVDHARARLAERRGGDAVHVVLDTHEAEALPAPGAAEEVLRVHEALDSLARLNPALAELVELRYFVGLSEAEVVQETGRSLRSVQRDWAKARALLLEALAA